VPDAGQAPAVYAARPSITIDGLEQPALRDGLTELVVEDTTAGLAHCEATFINWGPSSSGMGYLYFDRALLDFGKALTISAGAGDGAGVIFNGRVTSIEGRYPASGSPEMLVLAEDKLQELRMTRRTRTFENVTDAMLFQQVASQHGLAAIVDASGPTHKVLAQINQSDLAFLRERARAVDAELWVDGSSLNVKARAQRNAGSLTLTYGEALFQFSALADLALQVSGFTVSGWDTAQKQGMSFRATSAALGGELGTDLGSDSLLQSALGQRDQQVVHLLPLSSQETQALAEAHYRRGARRFVTGTGLAEGDARLRVGAAAELKGLGTLFDGTYYVSRVRHSFDLANGYRTAFEVERAGIGQ
jgi:phage protein D